MSRRILLHRIAGYLTPYQIEYRGSQGDLIIPQSHRPLVARLLPIVILNETVSSEHGLIAATISAIRDAQMDKAVRVWR